MNRISVRPEMLRWARERAGCSVDEMARRLPGLPAWESGGKRPTMRQLEKFAKAARVPLGYLFLPSPPEEPMPIADFRTANIKGRRPSPDLLATIYSMQRRQAWLRENRIEYGLEPLKFVGSVSLADGAESVGREMRGVVKMDGGWAAETGTWMEAVSKLREAIEGVGVMPVVNGIVGNDTHRRLNVDEFRGFSLCDEYAPLVFVNGSDAKSAQMFTLIHELAHIWLGRIGEGLSGFERLTPGESEIERFCDRAAAEFLLPEEELKSQWDGVKDMPDPFLAISRRFKISPIVAGRRALDLHLVDRKDFSLLYNEYIGKVNVERKGTKGGNFYNTQNARVGRRFAKEVICAAMEGRLSFREAYGLTGLRGGTFQKYAGRLGFDLP